MISTDYILPRMLRLNIKNAKELAKIYFEDLLGKSLKLFIDEKRTPALGDRINDIELL